VLSTITVSLSHLWPAIVNFTSYWLEPREGDGVERIVEYVKDVLCVGNSYVFLILFCGYLMLN